MIFLDNQLHKIATLKMYCTNGLWYARVCNGQTRIDTTESPSIRIAKYADSVRIPPWSPSQALQDDDAIIINMVQQDNDNLQTNLLQYDEPQIYSTMAWTNPSPLLQQSDTCSASDSDESTIDSSYQIKDLPIPSILIVITTRKKYPVPSKSLQHTQSNSNRRYYFHGRRYQGQSTKLQSEFQRMITNTLNVFQQHHCAPADARPNILNTDKTARVRTIGRYLSKWDRCKWQ